MLSNLSVAVQDAQRSLSQVNDKIESETTRLLAKRQQELDAIESEAKARLTLLKLAQEELIKGNKALELHSDTLETKITGQTSEIEAQREALGQVKREIETEKGNLTGIAAKQIGLTDALGQLNGDISTAQTSLSTIKSEVTTTQNSLNELTTKTIQLDGDYEFKSQDYSRKLNILASKEQELTLTLKDWEYRLNSEREDLAKRQMAADEREKVLERREQKVARDEHTNKVNAGFLNL